MAIKRRKKEICLRQHKINLFSKVQVSVQFWMMCLFSACNNCHFVFRATVRVLHLLLWNIWMVIVLVYVRCQTSKLIEKTRRRVKQEKCWTYNWWNLLSYRQEAYVKALGRGFSGAPFRKFTIRFETSGDLVSQKLKTGVCANYFLCNLLFGLSYMHPLALISSIFSFIFKFLSGLLTIWDL